LSKNGRTTKKSKGKVARKLRASQAKPQPVTAKPSPKGKGESKAIPQEPSPENLKRDMQRRNIDLLMDQQKRGKPLNGQQTRQMEIFFADERERSNPGSTTEAIDGPVDILASAFRDVADLLGVIRETLSKWRAADIGTLGSGPFSMRAYCQALHLGGKLRYCKPKRSDVQAIKEWAMSTVGSADPDAPDHKDPVSWKDEGERQNALKAMEQRRLLEIQLEQERGRVIGVDDVRASLSTMRDTVLAALNGVLTVTAKCASLTIEQRAELSTNLLAWIAEARSFVAGRMRAHAASLRPEPITETAIEEPT
jgi:hypothetical protein